MATAQINARIGASAKVLGDQALESVGYTPTRAIRALWGYAGRNLHDRKALRALLDKLEGSGEGGDNADDACQRMERVQEGPLIFQNALREMGISDFSPCDVSDEELLERAHMEKMAERGLS